MARAANLSARREDRQVILGHKPDSKMRMDVIIDNFDNGTSLSIDFSIIDYRNEQYCSSSTILSPGKAESDREKQKLRKYKQIYVDEGCDFQPWVVGVHGRFGACGRKLFDELAGRVHAARDYLPLSYHKQYWKARILMALHRTAATGMKTRMENVRRRRKGLDNDSTGNRYLPCDKIDIAGYGRCRG